ncbi:hypothetical protein ON010_g11311 [Phytophthora cinnamomi]|nr:hypothetical protein ON010_g11311 [Phytophthora cinnamomi]
MLIGSDGKAKLKPVLGSSEDKDDATSSMEDDVFAFAGAIVEVMESHLSSGFEDFTGSLASIREDQESVGGVNDAVLILIHSMTTSDPHDRPDMTSVVRALLNLADRERTWNDMQFPELLLHAPDVWTALRAASQLHYGGVLMCVRVLARLERVLARLWDEGLSFADGENVEYNWQTRTEHLIRSMRYLTRNYLPSGDQRELLKIAYTRRFTDEIQQIHYQLDALLVEFDNESLMPELSPNDKTSNRSVGDWELQWEYDCGDLVASYHKFLDDLEKYPATALKCEVAMEAMTLMKHELDNFRYGLSDVQLGLMVRAFDICVQRVGATVLSAPEWFIPAYEVRDESWWEGVHVTVQKAGDFFHHQNSRKLCEVVLRQADVWSELVHPHIVELFGACHVGPTPFFVFERARGGSLKEYLTRYRNAFGSTAKSPPHLWQLLYEAALGLQYLHERDIVHKKLCCDNIVVAIEKLSNNRLIKKERRFSREQNAFREVAKLNGLQFVPLRDRQLPQNYLVNSEEDCSGEGSTHVEKWLAPERRNGELAPGPPSLASDIYSFGTIIAEALARGFTASFEGLDDGDLLSESSLPAQLGHDACELVRNMCAQQPELRPTISHVVQQLGSLANRAQVRDRSDSYHSRETEERTSLGNGAQYSDAVGDGIAVADVMLPTETEPLAISQVLEALNSRILEPADGDIDVIPNVEASSGNDLNMQILLRLQDIYERLCAAEACAGEESDHTDNSSCLPNIVSDFAEVLTQFRAHVNASRTGNRITQIAAIRQRASDKFSFHKELDDLLDRLRVYRAFSVTETSQIHDWKWQWYAKRARQTECFEWTLIKPEAFEMLLDELKDARDREEMLAFLRFEVTRHRSSYTPAQVEAIGTACTDISRRLSDATAVFEDDGHSGGAHFHLWRPPKWFIPPYEVEFDPHESLGHGAFASVHMGKWLGTPVVIKKLVPVQSDLTAAKTNSEPQSSVVFYRELSIWYRLNHPYVVKLYGGCHVGGQPFFVLAAPATTAETDQPPRPAGMPVASAGARRTRQVLGIPWRVRPATGAAKPGRSCVRPRSGCSISTSTASFTAISSATTSSWLLTGRPSSQTSDSARFAATSPANRNAALLQL